MKKNFLLLICLILIFTSCNKENNLDESKDNIMEAKEEKQIEKKDEILEPIQVNKDNEKDEKNEENKEDNLSKVGKSNNKDYEWFIDQGMTGKSSNNNCGPSSTVMVHKWYDESTDMTAEKAREEFPENWGWWSTTTIESYFKAHNIPYEEKLYLKPEDLKAEIDKGRVAILCIDSTYIEYTPHSDNKTGRFYEYAGGHFIVVKGYKYIDNNLFWEVYDPNNHGMLYQDGSPMGVDRLYSETDVDTALKKWWNFILYVDPKINQK